MYAIHYRKYYDTTDIFQEVVVGIRSLAEAKNLRSVSGDLVVNQETNKVVSGADWLFDWEKSDPNCYARRAQKFDNQPCRCPNLFLEGHLENCSKI